MLFEAAVIILLLPVSTKCSAVLDKTLEVNGLYLSDYCPSIHNCTEGSHVMCMFYNPLRKYGPQCRNVVTNVTMTPDMVTRILEIGNAIRSKMAQGRETGRDGVSLPRGYGIFRLQWDLELATFAQVLADQCVVRHDICRASKKFTSPGQVNAAIRFGYPDWLASNYSNLTEQGLTASKLMYAAEIAMRIWYEEKSAVTPELIGCYPDNKNYSNGKGRLYMKMIYGSATHIGCGISAYSDYSYKDDTETRHLTNTVQITCNLSTSPQQGGAVVSTVPPNEAINAVNKCGCPAGSIEDNDCLCNTIPYPIPDPHKKKACPSGEQCDPTVVLLPIFTVENAPKHKLVTNTRHTNVSLNSNQVFKEHFENINYINKDNEIKFHRSRDYLDDLPNVKITDKQRFPSSSNDIHTNPHYRSISNQQENYENQRQNSQRETWQQIQNFQKPSIFSKAPRFELPGIHNFVPIEKKKDITRKDFTQGNKLASSNFYHKDNMLPGQRGQGDDNNKLLFESHELSLEKASPYHSSNVHAHMHPAHKDIKDYNKTVQFDDIFTSKNGLNSAEQQIINQKENVNNFNTKVVVKSDNKLLSLLDTLEQEVKHVELRDHDKEIFDAKIKKIYGEVVGNAINIVSLPEKESIYNIEYHDTVDENLNNLDIIRSNQLSDRYVNDTKSNLQFRNFGSSNLNTVSFNRASSNGRTHDNHIGRSQFNENMYKNNIRQRNTNDIISIEQYGKRENCDKTNIDKGYNRNFRKGFDFRKIMPSNGNTKPSYRNDDYKGNIIKNEKKYDLSPERRQYYQEKLDHIKRKLEDVSRSSHRKDRSSPRHMRAMRPSSRRGSENQMESVYMPARARVLHGY